MEPSRESRDEGNHRASRALTMPITLVTGASRGIGRAIALRLARHGHEIIAVARQRDELDTLVAAIEAAGGRARALVLDVSDGAAVASALHGVQVDVLVNNAGIGRLKPFM